MGPPTSTPAGVLARPDEQPGQPGLEALRVTQAWKASPRVDEGVLDGVFGQGIVAKDQPGDRVETTDRARDEAREGVMIALPRLDHELWIHLVPPDPTRTSAAVDRYVRERDRKGSILPGGRRGPCAGTG
jgi:hypothetical protein